MPQQKKPPASDARPSSQGHDQRGPGASDSRDLPVGTAAPRAAWPMIVCGILWAAWIGFLIYLAVDVRRGA